jgi:hypothetical protein
MNAMNEFGLTFPLDLPTILGEELEDEPEQFRIPGLDGED